MNKVALNIELQRIVEEIEYSLTHTNKTLEERKIEGIKLVLGRSFSFARKDYYQITQGALSNRSYISAKTYSLIENHPQEVKLDTIILALLNLGLDISTISELMSKADMIDYHE